MKNRSLLIAPKQITIQVCYLRLQLIILVVDDFITYHLFVGKMRPNSLALNNSTKCLPSSDLTDQIDFFECQARLQTEARMALAQAKEIARMQMEVNLKNNFSLVG